eukprot:gnl/TRDRNA2_/TRDRNA2_164155_c0_seq1.p1 gnl/TRDRNA2_/TRDRNA2_164155_c0~~gnl/TRDRNA2_/TRDRNA2_164155_c0_seq1.p1  ORF type:complete len:668 (-),score=88.08 gnl/TRDRNA2_/TRDRNA2_164155_c0_seq1:117-2120(-)
MPDVVGEESAKGKRYNSQMVLQEEEILHPAEKSHLHLVQRKDLERWKLALETARKKESMMAAVPVEAKAEEPAANKQATLKSGALKFEPVEEEWIKGFRIWPGIHNTLKNRQRESNHIQVTKARDVFSFGLLAIFSAVCFANRYSVDGFLVRQGVNNALVEGIVGQSSHPNGLIKPFKEVSTRQEMFQWLTSGFHYQIFNTSSTLREFYQPIGRLSLRQQMALPKQCSHLQEAELLVATCYEKKIDPETEERRDIIVDEHFWLSNASASGRFPQPNPLNWGPGQKLDMPLYGYLQNNYGPGGFVVDYSLNTANLSSAANTLLQDVPILESMWISKATRTFIVQVTLVNYNFGAYVDCVFLFETAPGGSVLPTVYLSPFTLGNTSPDGVADILDIFRLIIVVLCILFMKVHTEITTRVSKGQSGLGYIFSLHGVLDSSIVGIYLALFIKRLQYAPLPPDQIAYNRQHFSYAYDAFVYHKLILADSFFFFVVMLRYSTFMRVGRDCYMFWAMFHRAIKMFSFYCALFLPVFFGMVFLAHTIWNAHAFTFSTWSESWISLTLFFKCDLDITDLHIKAPQWTVIYFSIFYLVMVMFFMNGFQAIMVHSYFEVDLVEQKIGSDWDKNQWLDWALPGPIFAAVTGEEPGGIYRDPTAGGDDDDEDEDDEDDDE